MGRCGLGSLSIARPTCWSSSKDRCIDDPDPGERHWEILSEQLQHAQATGPLVMDAALAALAIEHGATLQTTDRDFSRFSGLKWNNPLPLA